MKITHTFLLLGFGLLSIHAVESWGWGEQAEAVAAGVDGNHALKDDATTTTTTRRTPQSNRNAPSKYKKRPTFECVTTRDACQNFNEDVTALLNAQVKEEFIASYTYMAMGYYFARDDVGKRGFAKFFAKMSDEEREHGQKLLNYLTKRGGPIELYAIPKPKKMTWGTGQAALRDALSLEHHVNDKLLDLHWLAQEINDAHLADYLEAEFLTEQVDSIKELADWLSILDRVKDTPLGETIFDQELYEGKR